MRLLITLLAAFSMLPAIAQDALRTLEGYSLRDDQYTPASIRYSPDSKTIAAISFEENQIRLWDATTGAIKTTLSHPNVVTVDFSNDGALLVSGGLQEIRIWDIQSGHIVKTFLPKYEGHIFASLDLSPDNKLLVSDGPGVIYVWNVESGQLIKEIKTRETELTFTPDGRMLTGVTYGIRFWSTETWEPVKVIDGHLWDILCTSFSPDGKLLASSSMDRNTKIWDAQTGKLIRTLKGHKDWVSCVDFSPNGKYLVTGSYDKTIRIWQVSDGALLHTFDGHKKGVTDISFSPDGTKIISGGLDNTVKVWDMPAK